MTYPFVYTGRYRSGLIFGDVPMPLDIWEWVCDNPWPKIGESNAESRAWAKANQAAMAAHYSMPEIDRNRNGKHVRVDIPTGKQFVPIIAYLAAFDSHLGNEFVAIHPTDCGACDYFFYRD